MTAIEAALQIQEKIEFHGDSIIVKSKRIKTILIIRKRMVRLDYWKNGKKYKKIKLHYKSRQKLFNSGRLNMKATIASLQMMKKL